MKNSLAPSHLNNNAAPNYCCNETCLSCFGPDYNNCLTCISGDYFLNNTCNITCPSNYCNL